MASVPALTLHPPEIARLLKKCISILISMLIPPPDPLLDARHRLCASEPVLWSGRDVFKLFCTHVYSFYEITGESPDSFVDIVMYLNFREMQSQHVTCLRQTTEHCSF